MDQTIEPSPEPKQAAIDPNDMYKPKEYFGEDWQAPEPQFSPHAPLNKKLSNGEICELIELHWGDRLDYNCESLALIIDNDPRSARTLISMTSYLTHIPATRLEVVYDQILERKRAAKYGRVNRWLQDTDGLEIDEDGCWKELRKFVTLLCCEKTDPLMLLAHIYMYAHMIWLVKRFQAGLPTDNEFAMLLWSKTENTGKTTEMDWLFQPMLDFAQNHDLNVLQGEFSHLILEDMRVLKNDECRGSADGDAAVLKSLFTGAKISKRIMHSMKFSPVKPRFVVHATRNSPDALYRDPAGARRLWVCHGSEHPIEGTARGAAMLKLKREKIYGAVKTFSAMSPFRSMPVEVRALIVKTQQEQLRTPDAVEKGVNELLYFPEDLRGSERVTVGMFTKAFLQWARTAKHPHRETTQAQIRAKLLDLGHSLKNHAGVFYIDGATWRRDTPNNESVEDASWQRPALSVVTNPGRR